MLIQLCEVCVPLALEWGHPEARPADRPSRRDPTGMHDQPSGVMTNKLTQRWIARAS